jgi:hypothetical protein
MLVISFALWSAASLLTPGGVGAGGGAGGIVAARVCVGVAQGFLIPAIHTVLSQARARERARAARASWRAGGAQLFTAAARRRDGHVGGAWLLRGRDAPPRPAPAAAHPSPRAAVDPSPRARARGVAHDLG